MIKRILVALDPDLDTPVATRYAIEIARRYEAEITALAVVDMGSIKASSRGAGIGGMYFAEKARARITDETRARARELLTAFEGQMEGSGVAYGELIEEGVPFERIVEDMKYHDLLIVGKEPHFFYGHPEEKTETLVHLVRDIVAPTLVVGKVHRPVNRVLIGYDGSKEVSRALRQFVHLLPFGREVQVEILTVSKEPRADAELRVHLAQHYLNTHGIKAGTMVIESDDSDAEILKRSESFGADMVIIGGKSAVKSGLFRFGSSVTRVLDEFPGLIFLAS